MRPPAACLLLVLMLVAARWAPARAQTPDAAQVPDSALVEVVLADGSVLNGAVVDSSGTTLTIRTVGGVTVVLERAQIRLIRPLRGRVVGGVVRRLDPNRTRLLFAPTARPLRPGSGYFAAYYLFFPFVAYGATERVTLAGGLSLLPGLPLRDQVFYAVPKVTLVDGARTSLAGAALVLTSASMEGSAALVFGVGTFGGSDRAVTAGAGMGWASEGGETAVLVVGGEVQVGSSVKLLTENYLLVRGRTVLVSGGIRFFGDRLSADLGLITFGELLRETDGVPFVPLLSFTYLFGE